MASKQVTKLQQQQRNKQPRVASKVVTTPLQDRSSFDPWSFLELIEAPQWGDLTLEGSSMEKDGFDDPWFDRSHKHHVKSLAGLNANMSWLRLGKSGQGIKTVFPTRHQSAPSKPEKKQSAGYLNKLGIKESQSKWLRESQSKGEATGSRVHKEEQDFYTTERGCNASRLFDSGKMGRSFSGCSSTSENEPSGSFKKHSSCSDRSSVSSSLQVCSLELKNFSSNAHRGSLEANLSEDFHNAPSSHSSGTRKSRNSSSASYYPPIVRYSSEVGVSTCTKSSEFGVSTEAKLQFACEMDCQSSGDSVVTSQSVAPRDSEGQAGKGCARASEEGTNCTTETSELKVDGDYNKPATGADSSTFNKNLLCRQRMANGALKSGIKAGRQRLEMRVSLVRPLPRKQLCIGKENAPPIENSVAANVLRVNGGHSCTKAPLALASSKTANARTVGSTLGGSFHASQVSKVEGTQRALQVKPCKGGISQNLYSCRASSTAHQRKGSESNHLPVWYEKPSNSERELAALVAQHNQKIWSLQLQNHRKGLR